MALVVENGTGVEGATSYISLADFKTYADSIGETATYENAEDDAAIEAALVNAARYLDIKFYWRGHRLLKEQPLTFPRTAFTDADGFAWEEGDIPPRVRDAQCAAALRVLKGGALMADIDQSQVIKSERKELSGALVKEVEYAENPRRHFPEIVALVRPFIYGPGSSVFSSSRLVRV